MKTLLFLSLMMLAFAVAVNGKEMGGQSRMIKGQNATLGQFPWQAGITIDDTSFCGGSIISAQWILTAAHCTEGGKDFKVRVGSLYIGGDSRDEMVDSTQAITHPDWDRKQLINDLGLIKLQTPLNFTENIKAIKLPSRSQMDKTFTGENVQDAGWGKLIDNTIYPSYYLEWIDTMVISTEKCREMFGGTKPETVLCVYSPEHHQLCEGDSGGALVWQDDKGEWTQIGINSYVSTKGCEADSPDVTTRVTSFMDWISTTTEIPIED